MLSKTLDAAVKKIGLTVTEKHAFGIYGGYLLTVYESGNKKTAFFNFLLDTTDEENSTDNENEEQSNDDDDSTLASYELSDALKKNIDKFSVVDYNLQDDGLLITTNQSIQIFLEMIDFCTELLKENGVKGSNCCSCCGNSFGKRFPKKITLDNKNYLYCENCALEIYEEHTKVEEDTIEEHPRKKCLLGILGAFFGCIISVFLYFAIYKWVLPTSADAEDFDWRYLVVCMGFVTSFLVYTGYKLFRKKATLSAYISVTAFSFLGASIGQYIGTLTDIANNFSLSFNHFLTYPNLLLMPLRSTVPSDLTEDFSKYIFSSDFYRFTVIGVALALLGAIIFLLGFYEKNRPVKEEIVIETLKIQNQKA